VTFDRHTFTSTDWNSYPILRFREAPEIETVLFNFWIHSTLGGSRPLVTVHIL
jgi:hypothetical protein